MNFSCCFNTPVVDAPLTLHRYPPYDATFRPKNRKGWFHPCAQCGTITANVMCMLILMPNDVDQKSVPWCSRCRSDVLYDDQALFSKELYNAYTLVVTIHYKKIKDT